MPSWLANIFMETFFEECTRHPNDKKNKLNFYCIDCLQPLCTNCLQHNLKHKFIQVTLPTLLQLIHEIYIYIYLEEERMGTDPLSISKFLGCTKQDFTLKFLLLRQRDVTIEISPNSHEYKFFRMINSKGTLKECIKLELLFLLNSSLKSLGLY